MDLPGNTAPASHTNVIDKVIVCADVVDTNEQYEHVSIAVHYSE